MLLLENLRFYAEEEGKPRGLADDASDEEKAAAKKAVKASQKEFVKRLASYADCYINDAFGTAHRAHASTALIADYFPNDKMFGYVMEGELKAIDKVLDNPARPFTAILGGSKVSTKISVIENLMKRVDNLILGGGMTYTFKAAQGGKVGTSICEPDQFQTALDILKKAEEMTVTTYLDEDPVCGKDFKNDTETKISPSNDIPDGWEGLDIGPKAIEAFSKVIAESKTILWNGPVGVFEMDNFAKGSRALAEAIVEATKKGAFSLIGGGDSVAAINKFGLAGDVSYVSTGGGALLEYMEGIELPGVAAIRKEHPFRVPYLRRFSIENRRFFVLCRKPETEERSGRKISSGSVVRNNATTHKSISGLLGSVRTGNRTQKDNPTDRILFSRQSRIDAAVGRNEPAATNNRRRRSTHAPPGIRHGPLHPVPDGENGFGPAGSRKRFFTGNDRRQKIGPLGASLRPDKRCIAATGPTCSD